MKIVPTLTLGITFLCNSLNVSQANQPTQIANLVPASYVIAAQDANSRVWQRIEYQSSPSGGTITNTHSYTELASGLNHLVNGRWVESEDYIKILPDGTAAAADSQHQAYFPSDIYLGQIQLVTPDGQHLRSQPLGLSYFDGTNTVMIAELTNSIGTVVGDNQVIYPNAFTGFKVDLRYTYTRAGFEQDVILRQQPPTPESLGLNPDSTRLQIITEFFSPPKPNKKLTVLPAQASLSLMDESLDFGAMQMVQGRAFSLGQNSQTAGALVSKHWLTVQGRQLLMEEVPVGAISEGLSLLPMTARSSSIGKSLRTAARPLALPAHRMAESSTSKHMLAAGAPMPSHGFLVDYITVNGSLTNYTFRGDTTYYISGALNLYQSTTFEGNAVLKFATNGSIVIPSGSAQSIIWKGTTYCPVTLTAKDDNTIGESFGSGTPVGYYGSPMLSFPSPGGFPKPTISGLRASYAQTAIQSAFESANIYDAQFVNCQNGLSFGGATLLVGNALFANTLTNFIITQNGYCGVFPQNTTFSQSKYLVSAPTSNQGCEFALTNCILSYVTNLQAGTILSTRADYNAFYSSQYNPWLAQHILVYLNSFPFQSIGAGSFYLAGGSACVNAGTTNVDSLLLLDIKNRTTYPPVLITTNFAGTTILGPQAQRDTDVPDIGYHYAPLDYCWSALSTGSNLVLTNGVAVGIYGSSGLNDGNWMVSQGTPNIHNQLVRYNLVQEQPLVWGASGFTGLFSSLSQTQLRFTDMSLAAGQIWNFGPSSVGQMGLMDCILFNSSLALSGTFWGGTQGYTNNLFNRSSLSFNNCASTYPVNFRNNLFLNGSLNFSVPCGQTYNFYQGISIENNLFCACTFGYQSLSGYGPRDIAYNGYYQTTALHGSSPGGFGPPVTGGDVLLTNLDFQAGPLGTYYYPTSSTNLARLINSGGTTANLLGLYHYTTQTNQMKEANSTVDVGYHYVAVDANGNPIDTDGDGIPDYIEDTNGNGLFDAGDLGNWLIGSFNGLTFNNGLQVFTPLK